MSRGGRRNLLRETSASPFGSGDMKWPMRRTGRRAPSCPSPLPHRRGSAEAAGKVDGRGQKRARSSGSTPATCGRRPGGPLAAGGEADDDLENLVGMVSETKEEHLKRHGGGRRTCPRCRFYLHGDRWLAAYGTSVVRVGGQRPVWLSERPPRWGGAWSLGCTFCADLLARKQLDGVASAGAAPPRRLGSRWARYEVRDKVIQAEHIKQHGHCEHHKLAERAFTRPDAPVDLSGQVTVEDERLLSGAVPQPEDWLRTWRAAKSGSSWAAAAQQQTTENFVSQVRSRAPERRALQQMGDVIREVIREGKRDWLREASSIALSFDDRQGYKLLLFRCDIPAASQEALAASPGCLPCPWRSGIVGCYDCLRHTTLEDLAEDYAVRTAKGILHLIQRFCRDDTLSQRFLRNVHIIVADGQLQKVAQTLKHTDMPNIRLITRDPAHMVRIACKDPLIRTGSFEAQHRRLFEDRHALLKDVQFSDLWQARLADSQAKVCRADGAQGGGVQRIMRHFGYAPQRFESWADPRRKYVCCLNAIAIMLADLAGDERQTRGVRERAQEALDAMTAKDIMEAGISADFGEVCMRRRGGGGGGPWPQTWGLTPSASPTHTSCPCGGMRVLWSGPVGAMSLACFRPQCSAIALPIFLPSQRHVVPMSLSCLGQPVALPESVASSPPCRWHLPPGRGNGVGAPRKVSPRVGHLEPRPGRSGGLASTVQRGLEGVVRRRLHHLR